MAYVSYPYYALQNEKRQSFWEFLTPKIRGLRVAASSPMRYKGIGSVGMPVGRGAGRPFRRA
jgi:hypothetical protein